MGNLANNEFDSAESLVQYLWASEGVMSGVCLKDNHFSVEELNSLLRVCYNHEGYPQKTADGKGFSPLRVEIAGNPCSGERTLKGLLDGVYQEGGCYFSTDEAFPNADDGPLLPVTDLLYLVVHLPRTGVNWKPTQSETTSTRKNKGADGGRDGHRGSGKAEKKGSHRDRSRDRDRKGDLNDLVNGVGISRGAVCMYAV